MGAVVSRVDHDGVVGNTEIIHSFKHGADDCVVLDHTVGILSPCSQSGFIAVRVLAHGFGNACGWN